MYFLTFFILNSLIFCPSMSNIPFCTLSIPKIKRIKVDFPLPDSPTSPILSF